MNKVFLYWDNSNIFISAKDVAVEMEGEAARFRVRIDSATCWRWRGPIGRSSTPWPWVRYLQNCGTCGTGWRTRA